MSTFLYALGSWAARAKWLVLSLWLILMLAMGAGALLFSKGANAPITIPGTESQAALETLSSTFPEVSGTSAQLIIVAPEGNKISDEPWKTAITDIAQTLEPFEQVTAVQHPFAELVAGGLSDDERAALVTVQIDATMDSVAEELDEKIRELAVSSSESLPEGTLVSYGGEMYSAAIPGISPTEGIGVIVAFIVLLITLGSLAAAGMPLLIALLGVGISIAAIFLVTAFAELTSTTPMLALMLGLAVGIDYTLFIVSRHQEQMREGIPLHESIARATATSGSAVVFAGLTVVIALVGLSVAGIPFLTALGIAAAGAVALAVVIAVTLTPAVLAMTGNRILSKRARRLMRDAESATKQRFSDRFFARWVRIVTAKPLLTTLSVLIVLAIASIPAASLRLALPNASGLAEDDPARVTYELTAKHFGEGANGPLILAGSIITSTDPLGLMEDLADEVREIPGVADVPLATPNQGADTGIIQVVPDEGPHAESTAELVEALREKHDEWEDRYGVSLAVTGFTAVGIDVSQLLFEALIPFSVLVVGLSLILLAMVFRSVWVPIKATLGYLLSVGVAFGAVVAVFQWGWLGSLLNVHSTGPILSFMPIILMGVLFGLAMDYEVFLVSRIREEVVHGASPQKAIQSGFVGSGKVVSAAAIIMFAVFAAFVPEGDPSIKVIALGLAVGVFIDAFIVRMVLVPAVLALLDDRAWRMPRKLQKI
ncbi:MAG TPA: MMPL family transporter, partial [Microbacteriaceae bacterium]|nr:MMPL family transporter [Microbacteriaceae bacterium]